MKTIILSGKNFEISHDRRNDGTGVKLTVTLINPLDGKSKERNAGWISEKLALLGTSLMPHYIYKAGCQIIADNRSELIKFFEEYYPIIRRN
jgi:hypothetical protein